MRVSRQSVNKHMAGGASEEPSKDISPIQNLKCFTECCQNPAKMQCPICKKLNLKSYFCSQDCYNGNWSVHKLLHNEATKNDNNPWPNYKFSGELRPFPLSTTQRTVPKHIKRPDYADHPEGRSLLEEQSKESFTIITLTPEEIVKSRKVCQLARRVMNEVAKIIKPGITTDFIDQVVHEEAIKRDCYPSPLNYYGFPKSCCTSVNEVICHGIPDGYVLKDGDIVNVDITLYYDGFHGDLNETFFVGNVDEKYKKLVKVTHECLTKAIEMVRPGVYYRDLGNVIQKHANMNGYSVVKSYTGHGCHKLFHCPPNVPHYAKNKAIGVMKAGHVFTIEPMINEGTFKDTCWPDNWTVVTVDGKRSAQFEQTLLVTSNGCEILTRRNSYEGRPYFMDTQQKQ